MGLRNGNPRVFHSKSFGGKPKTAIARKSISGRASEDSDVKTEEREEIKREVIETVENVNSLMAEICGNFGIPNTCICRASFGEEPKISVIIPNIRELGSSLGIRPKTIGTPDKIRKTILQPLAALVS
jgi:hypothetical protein